MRAEEFRASVRAWLEANAPAPDEFPEPRTAEYVRFSQEFLGRVHRAGYSGISWPIAYGGRGLGLPEEKAFWAEAAKFTLPLGLFGIGLGMCGPTILQLGTQQQRERYIAPMLRGEEIWCQMFSEPAAGSDVASLRMRAERDGDHFVLTGQKVWTTGAHYCDFGILLARTDRDVAKHRGLTMFIADMSAPGVVVRPLRDMTGAEHFNEVFFDEVRIPVEAVVGEIDGGWAAAHALLVHERLAVSAGLGMEGESQGPLSYAGIVSRAREAGLLDDPLVVDELVNLHLRSRAAEVVDAKLAQEMDCGIDPGSRGSIGKLLKARLQSDAADLVVRLFGAAGLDVEVERAVLGSRQLSIGGGTNEIQLSIIGERVLGLPREPRIDLNTPFHELRS
ncbi:acyl-CoA dehydrogenase family protein [Nocardia rhamnosiphila]|uniref:Acyl-CoA dehydrogenase family protein n=1 Tax=Nocardia rhamnosiphila TaxID=426716 RepID=A0ABV2WRE6_9NOCA